MGYNILIVDDSAVARGVIRKAIRLSGVAVGQIVEAANGMEALEQLDAVWVDIAFVDINMPVMDGIALVAEMTRRGVAAHIPVVMVSSYPRSAGLQRLETCGIREYLPKPFKPEAIRDVILRCLEPSTPRRTGAD